MRNVCLAISMIFFLLGVGGLGNEIGAADQYPSKPITFIVPVEPGADGDVMARFLCQKASATIGKPIVVVNKPGAGSSIAYRELYNSKPDGYTIGMFMSTIFLNKLQGISPFDHHDFTMIGSFYYLSAIAIGSTRTQRPFKTLEEAIAFAKSHPGEVTLATAAVGQVHWWFAMAFVDATGLKFNVIPQPGAAGFVVTQVAGGHVDLGVVGLPAAKPQIEAGNARLLGVFGSQRASGTYSNVPTLKEIGYDVSLVSTGGVHGPPKMPKDVTDRLVKIFEGAMTDPEFQKFLRDRFVVPEYLPTDQAIRNLDEQSKKFQRVGTMAGILK